MLIAIDITNNSTWEIQYLYFNNSKVRIKNNAIPNRK